MSGFATHAVVHRASVVPVDRDVPPPVAALLGCAMLTGGGAVLNVGRPQPGQTVAVVGLGGVGMAAVMTALSYAGVHVVGVDQLTRSSRLQAISARTRRTRRRLPPNAASRPPWSSRLPVIPPRWRPRSA